MTATALLAAAAAAAAVMGAWDALAALERHSLARLVEWLSRPLERLTENGHDAGAGTGERRRLALVAAAGLAAAGWLLAGAAGGVAAALGGPAAAIAVLRLRRRRHAEHLRAGAPEVARALADAVGAGHSARGALTVVAPTLHGPVGSALCDVARALALGESTEVALDRVRRRASCPAWDALTAAVLIQRDAGGDLAALLRRLAGSLEAGERLNAEARTATAQARFTAWVVLALPLGAALLVELASPGTVAGLLAHPLSSLLTAGALLLQALAILAVRRVARVPGAS